MMLAAALLLVDDAKPVAKAMAQQAIRRAERFRFDLAVTLCGDAGRGADYRHLEAEQRILERRFRAMFGRSPIDEIVMDDRGDCEKPGAFRQTVSAYRLALADARDAMGKE